MRALVSVINNTRQGAPTGHSCVGTRIVSTRVVNLFPALGCGSSDGVLVEPVNPLSACFEQHK